VVSMLATGSKVCGFQPGRDDGFLRVIKTRSTTPFGGEVKPEFPCHKMLWNIKTTWKYEQKYLARTKSYSFRPFLLLATR
jgi:hypothetical protein